MSFPVMLQIVINLVLFAFCIAIWLKLSRPAKDDPRLSKGLQLLQTKISILEDLSDRTETQVNQLTSLMELKVKEIQVQILNADKQIQKIETSMGKSMEVARIFQDRIPHQEIIERQNTIKYVKAARLAHQGVAIEDIAKQVDLTVGEIEFIAKVNKTQLQFSEEALPEWAKDPATTVNSEPLDFVPTSEPEVVPQPLAKPEDQTTLSELGEKFRQAMQQPEPTPIILPQPEKPKFVLANNSKGEKVQVRKVVFPKVDINDTLT